ncbi:UvrD-helicase domain-containing protein [Ruegeria arenilitoris]|uniref:UvrD-helicase domain-containing protein n=1 Tax=Ruegeria arenilitoris TaxID=1173585 RepID=UPI00147A032B|nr:UvrD-helicase domain-containing protein [Ruegeria arenilitoris]
MTEWTLSLRKNFQSELLALPPKENAQIQKKLNLLVDDPLPDAKVKKQLKNWKGGTVYRLRSGDYRIFYSLEKNFISLLALRRRSDDTYDEEIEAEAFGGPSTAPVLNEGGHNEVQDDYWENFAREQQKEAERPLPQQLTSEFLDRLFIPKEAHERLMSVRTEDELLSCIGVPDELLLTIHEAVFEKPLSEVLSQPEFIADSVDDLFRYKAGDLPGFLLKLSPAQEALVDINLESDTPTLVKGGPGSGKSTVALYRVAATVKKLLRNGDLQPRILFTTYTNALANVSTALLKTLLPEHEQAVVVRTADSLVKEIVEAAGLRFAPASADQTREALHVALDGTSLGENALARRKNKDAIARFSEGYLLDEICAVVLAQDLEDLDAYLSNPRVGREEPLSPTERELIWIISVAFMKELSRQGVETWSQLRAKAARLVTAGATELSFDGVVVDEVQDLEPSVVSLLGQMSKAPANLFLTADSRQSIYRSGFDWDSVLSALGFDVEVFELPGNYRSTEQIDKAAKNYLGERGGDSEGERYAHDGPMPVIMGVEDEEAEILAVSQFFKGATKLLHLKRTSCVVLVPTQTQGRRIAEGLSRRNIPAEFSLGRDLDISSEVLNVVPFQSAKGLEFPIVAVAGLWPSQYPHVPQGASGHEIDELRALQRRTLFVAMTRAMRALLIVKPASQGSPLLKPFDPALWNVRT